MSQESVRLGVALLALTAGSTVSNTAAQMAGPRFAQWEAPILPSSPNVVQGMDPGEIETRGDYRYEGLAFGGIVFGTFGAWLGSQLGTACPTVPGARCDTDRLGNAVALGLTGAVIGSSLGYLVGRFSPKRAPAEPPMTLPPSLSSVPDSLRRRVGYQHWRGAAIGSLAGGALGALVGAVIGGVSSCSDCSQPTAGNGALTLGAVGAGAGGVLGFLAGLASPKYVWIPSSPLIDR